MTDQPWFVPLSPFLFLVAYLVVLNLLSVLSGWRTLAGHYSARMPFTGEMFHFRSARLRNSINYNGCLTFGANRRGLYIVPFLPMRIAHAPLQIPWEQIRATEVKRWLTTRVELTLAREPDITLVIAPGLARSLFAASRGAVVIGHGST